MRQCSGMDLDMAVLWLPSHTSPATSILPFVQAAVCRKGSERYSEPDRNSNQSLRTEAADCGCSTSAGRCPPGE